MKITFRTNKLRKIANNPKLCIKEYGDNCAKKLWKRLTDLRDASTLEDVRNLPGRYHELKADRKGQWACDLEHPYRLIFEPLENPIPLNEDGGYMWIKILSVEIIEITDYH